ncbi:Aspartic proteinase nepenthesin-1 [Dichanthelium oligosanthes]|uniref:Aspartic proteinase nepenthesin-1 n=1 Tax=Dichanthelium oligosanthes TaxID=888268 RepID=A0A1E5UPV9_9POAL|nr:Aspartic proteinase nepenthesin-1 [Dichanthelium oligosanthes]
MLAARLHAASGRVSAQAPLHVDGYEYTLDFSIGTPPQKVSAIADTGSDLTWIKCGSCRCCTPHGAPYHPDMSSSFSMLPCSDRLCGALGATCGGGGAECAYTYPYGVEFDPHLYARGYLGSETFTLGDDRVLGGVAVPGDGFGCTTVSEGIYGTSSGIVGLGRGPLSLVSQLNVGAFSYCLSDRSTASLLLFGSLAALTYGRRRPVDAAPRDPCHILLCQP